VASDALLLHKTALRFHSPEETIAGALWGLVNLGVAHVLSNRLGAPSTPSENLESNGNSQNTIVQGDSQEINSETEESSEDTIVQKFTEEDIDDLIHNDYLTSFEADMGSSSTGGDSSLHVTPTSQSL
jgi:hypothetical protein